MRASPPKAHVQPTSLLAFPFHLPAANEGAPAFRRALILPAEPLSTTNSSLPPSLGVSVALHACAHATGAGRSSPAPGGGRQRSSQRQLRDRWQRLGATAARLVPPTTPRVLLPRRPEGPSHPGSCGRVREAALPRAARPRWCTPRPGLSLKGAGATRATANPSQQSRACELPPPLTPAQKAARGSAGESLGGAARLGACMRVLGSRRWPQLPDAVVVLSEAKSPEQNPLPASSPRSVSSAGLSPGKRLPGRPGDEPQLLAGQGGPQAGIVALRDVCQPCLGAAKPGQRQK